jgi:hypothetical protein
MIVVALLIANCQVLEAVLGLLGAVEEIKSPCGSKGLAG